MTVSATIAAAVHGALIAELDEAAAARIADVAARVAEAQMRRDGWADPATTAQMARVLIDLADSIESCDGDLENASILAIRSQIAWNARTVLGRPCMPGQYGGPHNWEHIKGSESASKCTNCDWTIAK